MTDQIIDLTAGAEEFSLERTITETRGKDITADTIQVSLGTYEAPAAWVTPDPVTHPSPSTAVVQLLINGSLGLTVGHSYYLWVRITDGVEVVPRRSPGRITIT